MALRRVSEFRPVFVFESLPIVCSYCVMFVMFLERICLKTSMEPEVGLCLPSESERGYQSHLTVGRSETVSTGLSMIDQFELRTHRWEPSCSRPSRTT